MRKLGEVSRMQYVNSTETRITITKNLKKDQQLNA